MRRAKIAVSISSAFFVRAGDAALELGELGGGEAHRVGHGLAMDETGAVRLFEQPAAMARGHFDEIAEHAIVLDLERLDVGLGDEPRLQCGDDSARLRRQRALGIERSIVAAFDEAAIAREQRRIVIDGAVEFRRKRRGRRGERVAHAGDVGRRLIDAAEDRCEVARAADGARRWR